MTQFDVFGNPDAQFRRRFPLVVCLQSNLAGERETQVVVPLVPLEELVDGRSRITPQVSIDEREYIALIPHLAVVPTRLLKMRVANLSRHRDELLGAVDLLFYGV